MIEHGNIVYSSDIEAQILRLIMRYSGRPQISWDADDSDEYDELFQFRASVLHEYGADAWRIGLSFVADSYWQEYADEFANGIYGAATDEPFWDNDAFAESLRESYVVFDLDGTEYWGDGRR
jgi:hypothetical protein